MIGSYLKRLLLFFLKTFLGTIIVGGTVSIGFVFVLVLLLFSIAFFSSRVSYSENSRMFVYGNEQSRHRFVAIPIHGIIVGDSSDVGDPLGVLNESVTYGYSIKKQLYELTQEHDISGVLLEINSPGGTIYGAKAIADGVSYFKEKTGRPVVAFISGLAASGAYWSAVSADTIVMDLGTSVGSIGVITGPFQYYDSVVAVDGGIFSGGVVTQKGIETTFITAGRSKDLGNPYRRLTNEEIESLQVMVNNEYESFVAYVAQRRKLGKEVIIRDLGAMLYDGKTALEKKMVDVIGSRHDAYTVLADIGGIAEGEYGVFEDQGKGSFIKMLLETRQKMTIPRTTTPFCGLINVRLAYHGNVAELCGSKPVE